MLSLTRQLSGSQTRDPSSPKKMRSLKKQQTFDLDECCLVGHRQSPINIVTGEASPMTDFVANGTLEDLDDALLVYKHNLLLVYYDKGSFTFVDDEGESHWKSLQFHFHSLSEHQIDGKSYDAELHIVFQNVENPNQLLVTGVFLEGDATAPESEFITNLNLKDITEGEFRCNVKLDGLYELFKGFTVYNYKGSLTTYPFSENVEWLVISEPLRLPTEQINLFLDIWPNNPKFNHGQGNNRELQPLNSRTINSLKLGGN
uniref:Carbonic anhydrase n=1 Tax=Euplotes harpa TaxID=151035 RepID=A0A7S3N6G2_9SPIT|mmetsp:Transcript_16414/g.18971  ORF Transcript_16414/g.18971 Transcript_16414/m.18971 type:complete len:259 (+) Transcript_16414:35-811(+)